MKLVMVNDTEFPGTFGIIREKDGFHPILNVETELKNAFNNRMKRIQADTREIKKENLFKSYLNFERKMMYVIALATIQKSKEWEEPITFLTQPGLSERFLSAQEQLENSLKSQCRKHNVALEIKTLPKSNFANLDELNGNWLFEYGEILTISRRMNKKVNSNAPFIPWEYNYCYSVDETEAERDMRLMFKKTP